MSLRDIVFILYIFSISIYAAAPDDISTNQRAWYDGVDIDADGDYTDNAYASIGTWSDKSGNANHLTSSATQPSYVNSPAVQRKGVRFNGSNTYLWDSNDIWNGNVNNSEIYIMATTDVKRSASIFASQGTGGNRISSHIPWQSNNNTYFDHGVCCVGNARQSAVVTINIGEQYLWHYTARHNSLAGRRQSVLQDGKRVITDNNGVDTYTQTANASFALGNHAGQGKNGFHEGKIYEAIFYQQELNKAQRRILSSYFSAKWDKNLVSTGLYKDVYDGDTGAHGDYDFFVGGIGMASGTTQSVGTSQGLAITDNNFLTNGRFITAGVNYLTSTPPTGFVLTDLAPGYAHRSNRTWYIDRKGNNAGTTVKLSFDANDIGISIDNGATYGLLHRTGISGIFTHITSANMIGGKIDFNVYPNDGVYAIGKRKTIADMIINELLYRQKTSGSNQIQEFVEFYVTSDGTLSDYMIHDLENGNPYIFPDVDVLQGEYVIVHRGSGTDTSAGGVHHLYNNNLGFNFNNSGDDLALYKPVGDDTTAIKGTLYSVKPVDYVAYGSGSSVGSPPVSTNGVTVAWNTGFQGELSGAAFGESISLTPNATDSNKAGCWERTSSNNADDNGCAGYLMTTATDAIYKHSQTDDNNLFPDMSIIKTSIVISDPVNNTSNPKRIPGAIIRYCFRVDNVGEASASTVKIDDSMIGNGKDNLSYVNSGMLIQNIGTECDCAAITDTSGTLSGTNVTINIGTLTHQSSIPTTARACAYIEMTID